MVPIAPDGSAPVQEAIDRLRYPYRQALAAAGKLHSAVSFDQQMHVIRLHAVVQHAEGRFRSRRKGAANSGEDARPAERRDLGGRHAG